MAEVGVLDGLLLGAISHGFDSMAQECPHRHQDQRGVWVCIFHESAPGDCRLELCPRVKAKIRGG
jgi:hypothetical protein